MCIRLYMSLLRSSEHLFCQLWILGSYGANFLICIYNPNCRAAVIYLNRISRAVSKLPRSGKISLARKREENESSVGVTYKYVRKFLLDNRHFQS